jgi:hypothetical protein
VMTPDGMKTGSSVIEVSYSSSPRLLPDGPHVQSTVTGEATYVDLGNGKNLFVLLTNRESGRSGQFDERHADFSGAQGPLRAQSLPIKMFGLNWLHQKENQLCRDFELASATQKPEIPFGNLPTLVTFMNINDPASVKVVQPDQVARKLGLGYKLVKTTVQGTTEKPEKKIEKVLLWLPESKARWVKMVGIGGGALIDDLWYDSFLAPVNWGAK